MALQGHGGGGGDTWAGCTHDACHSLDCGGREAGGARAPEKPSELPAVQSANADGNDLDVWFIDHRLHDQEPDVSRAQRVHGIQ